MISKLKFGLALIILTVAMCLAFAKPRPDDCQVAYEIAYDQAYNFCMTNIPDEHFCVGYACNEANRHVVDLGLGCPPQSCN